MYIPKLSDIRKPEDIEQFWWIDENGYYGEAGTVYRAIEIGDDQVTLADAFADNNISRVLGQHRHSPDFQCTAFV